MLSFHLHDLLGVSKWINVFGCIGLSPATLQGQLMQRDRKGGREIEGGFKTLPNSALMLWDVQTNSA